MKKAAERCSFCEHGYAIYHDWIEARADVFEKGISDKDVKVRADAANNLKKDFDKHLKECPICRLDS